MTDRILTFESIDNFRDYGGYAGADGGTVRSGVLWRSGHHGAASAADLAAVETLDIATVIDLRGDSERAANPCLRHPGFAGEVVFAPGGRHIMLMEPLRALKAGDKVRITFTLSDGTKVAADFAVLRDPPR